MKASSVENLTLVEFEVSAFSRETLELAPCPAMAGGAVTAGVAVEDFGAFCRLYLLIFRELDQRLGIVCAYFQDAWIETCSNRYLQHHYLTSALKACYSLKKEREFSGKGALLYS